MKKFLLSTSAIVGVGLIAAPAGAAERIKLSIGGFMVQEIGFADAEDDVAAGGVAGVDHVGFDQKSDTEVHFSGSTTLDNGIKISAKIEFEGDNANGGTPDEAWLQISSDSLGLLALGEDDAPGNNTRYGAPDVGIGDGDVNNWLPARNHNGRASNNIGRDGDEQKITYYTPTTVQKATGLQLGVAWIPEVGNNGQAQPDSVADNQSAYSLAVTWKSGAMGLDLGGLDANLQYALLHEADGTRTAVSVGATGHQVTAKFGYEGFTVSGGFTRRMVDDSERGTGTAEDEGHSWEAGVSYAQGPYKVSVGYTSYETEGNTIVAGGDEGEIVIVSGAYALSDGVDLKASVFDASYSNEGSPADVNEMDGGWGIVTGITVSF